jgi:feruloyl esterase
MKLKYVLMLGGAVAPLLAATQAHAANACEDLAKFESPNVTIVSAATVDSLSVISESVAKAKLSAPFCRVSGFIAATSDSRIGFEVWLPAQSAWNQKLQAVGNGGFFGFLNYRAMVPALNRHYAALTTDLGHTNTPGASEDASWALGHPEKIIDYKYRGGHLAALVAKQIIKAYYSVTPSHSYYTGCSAGGIQGMTEMLRYPTDFDGYVLGNATPDHLGQEMAAFWNTLEASLKNPEEALKPAHMPLIHREVLRQCAGKDGGLASDPFLTDPPSCKFDPSVLQCSVGQDPATCLTPAQVGIVKKIYQGPRVASSGEAIFSGLTPGTELGWSKYFTGKKNPAAADRPWGGFLMYMAYSDPDYLVQQKYLSFDFDKDYELLRKKVVAGETLDSSWNARNRNLDAFKAAGGKLIHYHGWDDPNIPALEAVKLFTSVVEDQVKRHKLTQQQAFDATQQFYRLFMVPGLGHCTGGDGPWSFGQGNQASQKGDVDADPLSALERWVEHGVAPEKFVGSHVDADTKSVDMTRPICVYPKIPVWKKTGSTTDANNFACVANPRMPATAIK